MRDDERELPTPAAGPWAGRLPRGDSSGLRHALDRLTALMVVATAGIVAIAFLEPLDDWLRGMPEVDAAHRGIADTVRAHGWTRGAEEPAENPRLQARERAHDDANHDHGAKLAPDDFIERYAEKRVELGATAEDAPTKGSAFARSALDLRDRADDAAQVTTSVAKGARLQLVRVVGEWALLMSSRPGALVFGWARTSELIVP